MKRSDLHSSGFAVFEAILVVVIIGAVVAGGVYIVHRKHSTNNATGTANSQQQTITPDGTTNAVTQLTQQDAQTEAGVDSSTDSQAQQDGTSSNSAINNVGGAYNENSL